MRRLDDVTGSNSGSAVVVLAHGSRAASWNLPIVALRERLRGLLPGRTVMDAYLEHTVPDLGSAIGALAADGHRDIVVFLAFISTGGHLERDIPAVLDELRRRHPTVTIALDAEPLAAAPEVVEAMARRALARFGDPTGV